VARNDDFRVQVTVAMRGACLWQIILFGKDYQISSAILNRIFQYFPMSNFMNRFLREQIGYRAAKACLYRLSHQKVMPTHLVFRGQTDPITAYSRNSDHAAGDLTPV
jgi:hypothetical protein